MNITDPMVLYLIQTFEKMFVSKEELSKLMPPGEIVSEKYAVGDCFITTREGNPAELLGYGTWEQIKDRFVLAAGDVYDAGSTGGEATHTLTVDEMPEHSHGISLTSSATASGTSYARISSTGNNTNGLLSKTGGGQAHNNMPPYYAMYIWLRTA